MCLQALVRNPLADPYLLGISSGASVGAVLALTFAPAVIAGLGVAGAAFAGALASVALVVGLLSAGRPGRAGRLILAGVAVGYLGAAGDQLHPVAGQPVRAAGHHVLAARLGGLGVLERPAGAGAGAVACSGFWSTAAG